MKAVNEPHDAYPIRTVAALTGINPITLRTWERRYRLLEPIRTPKGHRLYTKHQIAILHQVVELLDSGVPISQINFSLIANTHRTSPSQEEQFWRKLTELMVLAVTKFDEATLEGAYNEALSLYSVDIVTNNLLTPMMQKLGERWNAGIGSVAEEHFFGVYLRNKLGARFHHRKPRDHGPALLCACMPEDRHESGILLFALGANDHGYRCILLGADMPLEELPKAVIQSKSEAIVLSASVIESANAFKKDLSKLVLATKVPVFVGGPSSVKFSDAIMQVGAIPLGTDINVSFSKIAEALKLKFATQIK